MRAISSCVMVLALFIVVSSMATVVGEQRGGDLRARLYQALDRGSVDRELFEEARRAPLPAVRLQAVRVLASLADAETLDLLESFFSDPAPEVQATALIAAGRIGAAAERLAVSGLGSRHAEVRRAAAWAACHTGGAAAPRLLQSLPGEEEQVAAIALANLWRLPTGTWEPVAAGFATHRSPVLRRAAAASLARSSEPARLPALRMLAVDDDPVARLSALSGLARGALDAADQALLLAGLDDADWQVQAAACSALAARTEIAISAATSARITTLLDSPRSQLVAAALAVARSHPTAVSSSRLRTTVGGVEPWLAGQALAALATRGAAPDRRIIGKWLAGGRPWQRRAAAAAAALLPENAMTRLDRMALADDDAAVRLAWLQALPETRRQAATGTLWCVVRQDPDPAARAQAIDLLRQAEACDSIGELLEFNDSWRRDAMPDARAAALTAALQLAGGEGERRSIIRRIGDDPDPILPALVVAAAGEAAAGIRLQPRQPRHDVGWYTELAGWTEQEHWLDLVTDRGTIRLRLDSRTAAITCRTIFELAESGFYDGLSWHRVVPNFVVQGGDPRGDGWGGAGFVLPDEPSLQPYAAGEAGIATSGPNTGGSQLFIMLQPADRLAGHYTSFAEVTAGQDVLYRLRVGDRIVRVACHTGSEPPVPPPVLTGELSWQDLARLDGWQVERDEYTPDSEAIARLRAVRRHYRIVSLLGTWCHDSQREVPRLVRVLDAIGSETLSHRMLGVDRSKQLTGFAAGLLPEGSVELLPTILVIDEQGRELGRVVETTERPIELLLAELLAATEELLEVQP